MDNKRSLSAIENETANRILKVEIRYHIVKAIYIAAILIVVSLVLIYNSTKNRKLIQQDSGKTRNLIACALPAFTPEQYANASQIVSDCLKQNK